MSLSVLILTLNEEVNLRRCLKSVAWSDDVVVLDSGSTDRTVAIAERHGARVLQRPFDSFAGQRNWGLAKAGFKHDWVLHLDADEVVPPEMWEEIQELLRAPRCAAYRMSLKLMFQERWIRHASMYPAYQVRLGRRDRLRFKMVGHGQREDLPPGEIGTLQTSLVHYSFEKGLTDWFEKHNRYSTAEARDNLRLRGQDEVGWLQIFSLDRGTRFRAMKHLSSRLPFRPLFRFLYMALLRRGILDGVAGLHYCALVAIYEYMIVLKVREMQTQEQRLAEEEYRDAVEAKLPAPRPVRAFALSGEPK